MQRKWVGFFACPRCKGSLQLGRVDKEDPGRGEVTEGLLLCVPCAANYPVVRSIPRFVSSEGYARSFGYQWNQYGWMQIDKIMKNDLSRDRFKSVTGWPERLEGQRILEAGCGAGRFAQLALETGAEVFSFDLSNAVEANLSINGEDKNLNIFQASIYEIPLHTSTFDKIFCMGVLQHCPDVKQAFLSLIPYLKRGGEIVIDVYRKHEGIPPLKYWARPFVKHMRTETVHRLLRWTIPPAFDLKKALYKVPAVGKMLGDLIPIGPISHKPRLNYSDEELKEVKILSALDMLTPVYDQPQTMEDVQHWFAEAGLVQVETKYGYNGINAKGRKFA